MLGVTRASITIRTSDDGYATGPIPDLTSDFPAADLAWLMEGTKEALFGPEADRASSVLNWIRGLQQRDLWGTGEINELVTAAIPADISSLDIFILSSDPETLAFPWELVNFPEPFSHFILCQAGRIERIETTGQLLGLEIVPVSATVSVDRISTMLISPRPESLSEVPFGPTVGAALVAAARSPEKLTINMVRPPTIEAVCRYLNENDAPDVVHFDGHGKAGPTGGRLLFEGNTPEMAVPVSGKDLADAFKDRAPRTVLLNACRSSYNLPGLDGGGSVAGDISRNFPEAVVVAMNYIVGVPLVLRLMQAIYPAITRGEDASSAVAQVRRDLFSEWKEDKSEFPKPHFLTTRVFRGKCVAQHTEARIGSPALELSAEEKSLTDWTEEILAIDRLLARSDGLVSVVGMIGSGKTSLAKSFRQYYSLTTSRKTAPPIIDLDGRNFDDIAMLNVDTKGVILTARREHARGPTYELHYPPHVLAASLVQQAMMSDAPAVKEPGTLVALAFKGSNIATMHLASGAVLARLASRIGLREAIDCMRWGSSINFEDDDVNAVRALITSMNFTKAQLVNFSVLGLFDGWIPPGLPVILTNGGLIGDRFFAVFGRHITEEEWSVLFDAGAMVGLLDVGPMRIFRLVPVVGLVLRSILASEFGEDDVTSLQYEMTLAMWGWLSRSSDINFWNSLGPDNAWRNYQVRRFTLSIMDEQNIIRALIFAIQNGHDEVAAPIARRYVGRQIDDHFRFALRYIRMILSYERRPEVQLDQLDFEVARALTYQWHADLGWPQCLQSSLRALELARSLSVDAEEIVRLLCMQAHALARLHRVESALGSIKVAASECVNADQRDAVLEEFSNIVELLNMPDDKIQESEQVICHAFGKIQEDSGGAVDRRPPVRSRMEEIEYWESEQRRSLISGNAVRAAQSASEIGRLLALAGETAQADAILRSALDAQAHLGAPVGRTQYYLGLAWEIGGDFEKAERWLRGAVAAASATSDERLAADCTYQLGIVQLRKDDFNEALETFHIARQSYLALGRDREAADALFMAAQAKLVGGGEIDAVEQMLRGVISEQPLDPEITARARELLENIRDT